MTPIMYDIAIIDNPYLMLIFKCNPLYWFVYFVRRIMLYGVLPEINVWIYCAVFAIGFLLLGLLVFKKNQNKFIYYV